MACYTPLKAYRAAGGRVVFSSKEGYSDRPLDLPCGQCRGCRAERSRQWAIRCVHEAQMHDANSFVTLTYSPQELPADGSLVVKHWQDFAKRLRKRVGSFRFFHCGEYGEDNFRPHYHACMFGVDFASDRVLLRENRGHRLYTSSVLAETWGKGFCTIGDLTYESAAYVARYIMKKATGDLASKRYGRVDDVTGEYWEVRPEYVTMSRRPGIGSTWFDSFMGDVYPEDEVVHNGRRFRPPRFYDSKLDDDVLQGLKDKRLKAAAKSAKELTPERLRVREKVAEARLSRLVRNI